MQAARRRTTGPRERLLHAARDLTYAQGVGVGVDAILERAQVARRSLYQHFGGKDGLISEVLRTAAIEDENLYRQALQAGGDDPRSRLLRVFDRLQEITSAKGFRGCRYTAATLGLANDQHPAHAEVRAHKERVRVLLRDELSRMSCSDADRTASELLVLIEGALVAGVTRPNLRPGTVARRLAELVLDTRCPDTTSRTASPTSAPASSTQARTSV